MDKGKGKGTIWRNVILIVTVVNETLYRLCSGVAKTRIREGEGNEG